MQVKGEVKRVSVEAFVTKRLHDAEQIEDIE